MNRVSVLSVFVLMMFTTGICQADLLVITYRSGKTQKVILDEPSVGINSWHFVGGTTSQQQLQKMDGASVTKQQGQVEKESPPQTNDGGKVTGKAPDKKSDIRIKWNAEPIIE